MSSIENYALLQIKDKYDKIVAGEDIEKTYIYGTYKVQVEVKAAGNTQYKAGSKTITVTVRVK